MGPGMELTTSISRQTTGNTSELPTAMVGTTWRLRSPNATMRHVSLSCRECRGLDISLSLLRLKLTVVACFDNSGTFSLVGSVMLCSV